MKGKANFTLSHLNAFIFVYLFQFNPFQELFAYRDNDMAYYATLQPATFYFLQVVIYTNKPYRYDYGDRERN